MRVAFRAANLPAAPSVFRLLAALSLVAAVALPGWAADKFLLVYKAQAGQVRRGKGVGSLSMTVGANKINFEIKQTGKTTFTNVAASGDITYEDVTESSETTVNGEKAPQDDEKDAPDVIVIRPSGMLVSYKDGGKDPDANKLGPRLAQAGSPVFSDKPVGVGDKWSIEYPANEAVGTKAARADYEVLGEEKVGETPAVKIKIAYAETGSNGIALKGTFLVEKSSGDKLSGEYEIENVPFGPPGMEQMAGGKFTEERVEGGPLPGAKNAPSGKTEVKKDKTIDEVVKGFEKMPGLLTLYRKKEPGKDTLYLEIPEDKLGTLMLLQTTASSGTADTVIPGDPIADLVFQFTKNPDEKILLTVPNWFFRANPATPTGQAVRRTFPDGYLQAFKIEAKQAERKSLLIDVSDLFRSDFSQISLFLATGIFGGLTPAQVGYGLDREKTYIAQVKNFPENLYIQTHYHFTRGGRPSGGATLADPRSAPLLVSYNLIALPNEPGTYKPTNGYRPRPADPRVGYFTTQYANYDDDSREDQTDRWILRWDLRKADPTAKVSEPVKPITFYLDNAIPTEYRPAVRKGVLLWNKAFERLGYKNAVVVKDLPEGADHADLRYNVIRWTVTPDGAPRNGVAITLFRENPLTGQILNGSITIDAAFARIGKLERRELIDPAVTYQRASGADVDALRQALAGQSPSVPLSEEMLALKTRMDRVSRGDAHDCTFGMHALEDAYNGLTALRLLSAAGIDPVREKQYADQFVTEVVAHEMGHMLGLRHNFIASTELTLEQLKDPKIVREKGIGASLMDYNAFNISAIKAKGVDFFSQTVGTYDLWAVEYGYTPFEAGVEKARLKQIARKSNLPGHAFQTDPEAIVGLDPRVVRFDISADPLKYWERKMNLSRYLLTRLDTRVPRQGESYWEFTKAFNILLNDYSNAAGFASRYVGGLSLNRNHRGDMNERPPTEPMDALKQKQALALLNNYLFSPAALRFPERYYTRLTANPNAFMLSQDFPVADQISGIQRAALNRLFSAPVLRRVANNEFKKGGDGAKALTLPALFNSVSTNVWAELGKKQSVPTLRRQLQRAHVDAMVNMALKGSGVPEDAQMLAWAQLRSLKARIAAARKDGAGYDEYTRLHLSDAEAKIERALDAELTIGGESPSPFGGLLQLLLGGRESGLGTLALPR